MKKKIMAILMTVVMGLTLCGMSPVSAEEAVGTILYGDVNLDSKVSVLDVITISKYNAEIITLNEDQLLAADCDADGVVNLNDVDSLMNRMVENITELPAEVKARERDYFESHTFEEFLALSEEEIGAISETIATTYEFINRKISSEMDRVDYAPCLSIGFTVEYINFIYDSEMGLDEEQLLSDMRIPASLIDGINTVYLFTNMIENADSEFIVFNLNSEKYGSYAYAADELGAKICAWLKLNPIVRSTDIELIVG